MSDSERTLHRTGESRVAGWVQRETWGYKSGLELGCGVGVYTREMLTPIKCGIDAFEPYILEARETPENAGIEFIYGDMRRFERYITQTYQLALIIDSLEHLDKADALALVEKCKLHFDKIAMFLPIGRHDQDPCDGNELQRHLSTWDEYDLYDMEFLFHIKTDFHINNPVEKQAAAFATWVRR